MIQRPAPHCFGPGAFFEPAGDFPRSSANDSEQSDPKTVSPGNKPSTGDVKLQGTVERSGEPVPLASLHGDRRGSTIEDA